MNSFTHIPVTNCFYSFTSLRLVFGFQVYILGYIAKAVRYKVPDRSSTENGGFEEGGECSENATETKHIPFESSLYKRKIVTTPRIMAQKCRIQGLDIEDMILLQFSMVLQVKIDLFGYRRQAKLFGA